jgi:hypothetical protein
MMMRAEDVMQGDQFWNVRDREEAEERTLRTEIASITQQLEVARRCEALKHAPGYADFLKSLQGLHAGAREQLVGNERLTNDGLREMRGRVKGLESVLALLTSTTETSTLAARLTERQNQLTEALKRRPKPQPEQVTP